MADETLVEEHGTHEAGVRGVWRGSWPNLGRLGHHPIGMEYMCSDRGDCFGRNNQAIFVSSGYGSMSSAS